jgi:hypothetical protein
MIVIYGAVTMKENWWGVEGDVRDEVNSMFSVVYDEAHLAFSFPF